MANEMTGKTRMDLLKERMAGKYPDDQFETDDDVVGRFSDDYDAMEKDYTTAKDELAKEQDKNKKINDLFTSDDRSARFMMDWASGKDPLIELYKRYGDEAVDVLQDPDKLEEFKTEREAYLKDIADSKASEEAILAKAEASLDAIDNLEKEGKWSKEDIDRALDKMAEISKAYTSGEFGEEEIKTMLNALDHDKHVEEAGMTGEVRGKNSKMKETLRKPKPGDGLPDLDGGGNLPQNDVKAPDLGALNRFQGEPDIFARGGEKRVRR